MRTIVFRVDAGVKIGTGHVMRCLVLAELLHQRGANITFVCRKLDGDLIPLIKEKRFSVITLTGEVEKDAEETKLALKGLNVDWLVVDHYQIDHKWEKQLKNNVRRIMVIDDLANRPHDCDLLLDQNFYDHLESRYNDLVSDRCKRLLGPRYLLLRPEFIEARKKIVKRDGVVRRLFIFYGGSDPTNETTKVLRALENFITAQLHVDVVVGRANPNREQVKELCEKIGSHYYCQIDYIAELMAKADLSLGAGGVALWERCFLELPSITTIVAENQIESTEAAARYKAIWNLGWHEAVNQGHLADILSMALASPDEVRLLSQRSGELLNGSIKNNVNPVVKIIMEE